MSLLDRLRASLREALVVPFGAYQYFVHPLTDGIPPADPALLEELVEALVERGDFDCDKIVTAEAMGFPLAALLSVRTRKPYVLLRKREYGLPGEIRIRQVTGYSRADLFMNYVEAGDRVVIVDDVISTGGTLRAIGGALTDVGATIADVLVVFDKMEDRSELERALGVPVKPLLRVQIVDGRVVSRP
ncbi:MAG: hypoxanthine/guanine phosphoribosyltransferase [Thermoplasmata archaeon]|nr:hypoxanthine/guanine phosphoribosyltransferase [Thermoplasmata archaeon]